MSAKRTFGIVMAAVVCLGLGAAGGAWYVNQQKTIPPSASPAPAIFTPPAPAIEEQRPIVVSIPSDALERMGLAFAPVTTAVDRAETRVPGIIEANGYRDVPVMPVAGGILTDVSAELGQTVKRGEKLARIFSQELADAQAALIGMEADLEVVHKRMLRTQELLKLGAASREELEEIEGEHQQHIAHIEQARQKLILLGLTPAQADQVRSGTQVSSEFVVPAPMDGIILSRTANPGQVVAMGQELFKVTDLTSVWVEGSLLEDDFAMVHVGSQAVMTTPAYPKRTYHGSVDYIDPRVDPQTRTAKVRVIVDNSDRALRLGMYADLMFTTSDGGNTLLVPASAIQQIGPTSVVYVPVNDTDNQFEQRKVVAGGMGDRGREILEGLRPGERVVTDGSFLLRAEALRQHPQ